MAQLSSDGVWLKPGQVAERAGIAVSALHFYESIGLIRSRRTVGNRREYRRDTLRLIAFIRASQRLGISLDRIKEALDGLPHDKPPTKRDWARLSRQWSAELTSRIEELTALRDNFSNCIACGCLSLTACPFTNPGDALGQEGPGARRFTTTRRSSTNRAPSR